jgi:hypothetical protein
MDYKENRGADEKRKASKGKQRKLENGVVG